MKGVLQKVSAQEKLDKASLGGLIDPISTAERLSKLKVALEKQLAEDELNKLISQNLNLLNFKIN